MSTPLLWKALDLHSQIFGTIWNCPVMWHIKRQHFEVTTAKKELLKFKYVMATILFYALPHCFKLLSFIFKSDNSGITDAISMVRSFLLIAVALFTLSLGSALVNYGPDIVASFNDLQKQEMELKRGN